VSVTKTSARPKRKAPVAGVRTPGRPKAVGTPDLVTRRMILDAALQSFSQNGFEGTSMTQVARIHRVSPPLVHYYFKTKDELWRAAMDQGIGDMVTDLQDVVGQLVEMDCIARLKFFIRRYVAVVIDRPAVFRIIVRESDTPGPRLTWLSHHYLTPFYQLLIKLLEEGQQSGRIKKLAPPYHMAQIITGAAYHFLASRNRVMETYGVDVNTREVRELHTNAVIEMLFAGMLTTSD
jgi:TetR/AcrR family transcriptional regulator